MAGWKFPSLKKIAIGAIGAFFLVQILSLVISALFTSIPVFQGGTAILLMLLAIGIMTLFVVGTSVDELKKKESLVFVVIVFALIGLAYWKLPDIVPDIFSISPQTSYTIQQMIGRVVGG